MSQVSFANKLTIACDRFLSGLATSSWTTRIVCLAVIYFFLGRLALPLSIPAGYATPLWPPSGIALACILLQGNRVWPGIWLGAYLIYVGIFLDSAPAGEMLEPVALGSIFATGASLQAIVAASLIRRFVGYPTALEQEDQIGRFLLFGGPAGSLIGATANAVGSGLFGYLAWSEVPIHWWTWWVGDTIAVFLVTPLVLACFGEPKHLWKKKRLIVGIPLSLALAAIPIFFVYARAWESKATRLDFQRQAALMAHTVNQNLQRSLDLLLAIEGLFVSAPEVDRGQFQKFTAHLLQDSKGIQALEWAPRVKNSERSTFEHKARRNGLTRFRLRERTASGLTAPVSQRDEYYPIYYVEPIVGNETSIGFDVASNPARLKALNRARDSGQAIATEQLSLLRGANRSVGLTIFYPIYATGPDPQTVAQRRERLQGYILATLRLEEVIHAALEPFLGNRIGVEIFDESATLEKRFLYLKRPIFDPEESTSDKGADRDWLNWSTYVEFGGRHWRLSFTYPDLHLWGNAWGVPTAGLIFSGLLVSVLLVFTGRATDLERHMVEAAPNAIILVDQDGNISLVNNEAERLFGYSRNDLLGKKIEILIPERFRSVHPEHRSFYLIHPRSKPMGAGRDLFALRQDGTEVPVEISINSIRLLDREYVLTSILDITARKRAEEALREAEAKYRGIFENALEGIFQSTPDGRFISANPALAGIFGFDSPQMLIAKLSGGGTELYVDPNRRAEFHNIIQEKGAVQGFEYQIRCADGTLKWVSESARAIRDVRGRALLYEGSIEDITGRRVLSKMKDEFVSMVSHELRTPLTSIRASLGMLNGGLLGNFSEKANRMLHIAVENTDRLVRLINDILDIERMESGRVTIERQSCNAADLMVQAIDVMRAMASKEDVELKSVPLSATIFADPDRIIQVLTNLLSNAIKFSNPGGVVTLEAKPADNQLLFAVKDQGRGIPADKLRSIFERFQQVDASDSRRKGGTGLGLAICRTIVHQHGGTIWAESVLGVGSTLYFTLPLPMQDEANLVSHSPSHANGQSKVLLCDNNPSIRAAICTLLEQHGYQVMVAASGEEALAATAGARPDVILLDPVMPGMNGWDTMAALKESSATKQIPIIIFSVQTAGAEVSEAVDTAGWVSQPPDEKMLVRSLERALSSRPDKTRILLVEDDRDLGNILSEMFQNLGCDVAHVLTVRDAIRMVQKQPPDLIVLDLILPDGDGYEVVDCLRQNDCLCQTVLVVYTAKDLAEVDRKRLSLGETYFFTKARVAPEDFEKKVVGLLNELTKNQAKRNEHGWQENLDH